MLSSLSKVLPAFRPWSIFALLAALSVTALAQTPLKPIVPRSGILSFRQLSRNSGYIFSGTVQSVSRVEADPISKVGTMRITFHVDHALRGVRVGQTLAIREWAGLWEAGEHYRVGERVALFLFSPGKLGLTSPVGGRLGRFQVNAYGGVMLNPGHLAVLSEDSSLSERVRGRGPVSWKEFSRGIRRELKD